MAVLLDDVGVVAVQRVPADREAHCQELEGDSPLDGFGGAVAGVADPEELFAVLEADLDWPAVGVALEGLDGSRFKLCGDHRDLLAVGSGVIPRDDHADGGVRAEWLP